MAKLHKVTMFLTDHEGYDTEQVRDEINYRFERSYMTPHCIEIQSTEEFPWYDDIILNCSDKKEDFERFMDERKRYEEMIRSDIVEKQFDSIKQDIKKLLEKNHVPTTDENICTYLNKMQSEIKYRKEMENV